VNGVMRVGEDDEPRASRAVPRNPSLGRALSPGRRDPVLSGIQYPRATLHLEH
jgi:hypothetical protein